MTVQTPIPDFTAARRAMVDSQLRPQGVTDHGVLSAMGSVARERFVPDAIRALAYGDRAIALGDGRFLAAPAVLGTLLTHLAPEVGERSLVVGAGTGYAAAVLTALGLAVTALEAAAPLAEHARGAGLTVVVGPLEAGHSAAAPYDIILVDGAVEFIPDALTRQLGEGGRLGAALIERGATRLIVGRKAGGAFGYLSVGDAGVAPLPGFTRPPAFSF